MSAAKGKRRTRSLDRIDRKILTILQRDARISNKELAQSVNLSQTPCLRRVGLLERAGFIQGYGAILDRANLGYTVRAFITIKRSRESDRDAVWRRITAIPEVITCHVVSGEFDLLVELVARDMEHYGDLLLQTINKIDGVYDSRGTLSMKALKTNGDLPIVEV